MPIVSIVVGALLGALGAWGYLQQSEGERSATALIPAFVGAPLVLCGLLGLKESLLKHSMHAAAMVGLLGMLGGVANLVRVAMKGGIDWAKPGVQSTAAMTGLCAVFVALCVNSFVQVRRRRRAAADERGV